MTEPERVALEHIRRVVDSVIGDAATASPIPAGGAGSAALLPVPYTAQLGSGADQFANDSGAASGVMLVQAYTDKTATPNSFFTQSGQTSDAALSFTHIANALNANSVASEMRTNLRLSDLAVILSSGRPAILLIKQTVLKDAGLSAESYTGPHYVVAVGLDVANVYIHDPLRADESGKGQPVPWMTLYQAWTQAQGYQRAALVPRIPLLRRVKVTAATVTLRADALATAAAAGTAKLNDAFEVTVQKNGWGKVAEGKWLNLSSVTDL